mgnify:CR=1 FL=1
MKMTFSKQLKSFSLKGSFLEKCGKTLLQKRTYKSNTALWERRRFLQVLPISVMGLIIARGKRPTRKKMLSSKKADWWEEIES